MKSFDAVQKIHKIAKLPWHHSFELFSWWYKWRGSHLRIQRLLSLSRTSEQEVDQLMCINSSTERGSCHGVSLKITFHPQPRTNQPTINQPNQQPPTNKQARLQTTARWHQQNNRWRIWRFDSSFELSRYLTAVLTHQKIILRFWTWIWKSSQKTPTISSSLSSPYSSSSCRSKGKLQNTTFKFAKKIFLFSVWLCFSGSRFSEVRWFVLLDQWGIMRPFF